MSGDEGAEAAKSGVDQPKFVVGPGQFVDFHVAGDVDTAGQKTPVGVPAGSSFCATAGMLWYSQTVLVPPIVSRCALAAMPIGLANVRKWVFRLPRSLRTTITLPAW